MKEQMNFPTSRESATPFEDDGRIDLHAASSGIQPYAEFEMERRQAREQDTPREPERSPTLREMYTGNPPVIGVLLVGQRRERAE